MIVKLNRRNSLYRNKETGLTLSEYLDKFLAFGFFVYLSAYLGNKQGTGTIDALILRGSFAFYIGVFAFKWLIDTMDSQRKRNPIESQIVTSKFHLGVFVWFLIFTFFGFISYFWALNGNMVFAQKNSFISILALCVVVPYSIRTKEDFIRYFKLFALSNLYAIILMVIKLPISQWKSEGRLGHAIGWHPNDLGIHLACACVLCVYIASVCKGSKKVFYYTLFVVFATVMFYTGSRQAILMLAIGLLTYCLFVSKNSVLFLRNMLIIGALSIIIFYLFTKNETLYNLIGVRFEGLINYFTGEGEADASSLEREYFLGVAKDMFPKKPIVGHGLANFAQYLRETGYHKSTWCHNNYLELLTGVGIIGFTIYYSYLVTLTAKLINPALKKNKIAIVLLSLMIMYFVDDIVAVNYYYIYNSLIYILSYSFLMMYKKNHEDFD